MKKLIILLTFLPFIGFSQNITNTLGINGDYIIETTLSTGPLVTKHLMSLSNGTIEYPASSGNFFNVPKIIIGDYASNFNLPTGDIDFVHNNGSEKVNIVVGNGNAYSSFPKLQFYYTPGPLSSPTNVGDGNVLGIINFGGYLSSQWSIGANIRVSVDGSPGGSLPTKLEMQTTNSSGNVNSIDFSNNGTFTVNPTGIDNDLVLNSSGNLIVDASITSKAIKSVGTAYSATLNDQTIIVTAAVTITLPAASALKGKVYTIKKGAGGNFNITVASTEGVDGLGTSFTFGGNNYSYLTVQSDGTKWWIIARGTGN